MVARTGALMLLVRSPGSPGKRRCTFRNQGEKLRAKWVKALQYDNLKHFEKNIYSGTVSAAGWCAVEILDRLYGYCISSSHIFKLCIIRESGESKFPLGESVRMMCV